MEAASGVPWMPTYGDEIPIQRVPSGFPGPGGIGFAPSAQAEPCGGYHHGFALHGDDLELADRGRVRGLARRDAERPLELVPVVEEELVRVALDHDRVAEVGLGHGRLQLLVGQLEAALVLADRERELLGRDDLHQAAPGHGLVRHRLQVAEREARVDGLAVGIRPDLREEALQLPARDVDLERHLIALASHAHGELDGLGDVRGGAELRRRDAELPALPGRRG